MDDDEQPERIQIVPDDHHAEWVGRVGDGRSVFVTTPFVPATSPGTGREFIAVYLWNRDGSFAEARIDDLGPRALLDPTRRTDAFRRRLQELGPMRKTRITVAPFEVERFGIRFGLISRPPEDEEDQWTVTVEPGHYMAFYAPWDGEYET